MIKKKAFDFEKYLKVFEPGESSSIKRNVTKSKKKKKKSKSVAEIQPLKPVLKKSFNSSDADSKHCAVPKKKKPKKRKKKKHDLTIIKNCDYKNNSQNNLEELSTSKTSLNQSVPSTTTEEITNQLQSVKKTKLKTLESNDSRIDIEMVDISQQSAETSVTTVKKKFSSAVIYITMDTNIFLEADELKLVESLIDWNPLPGRKFEKLLVVVPWVVLQELDHLKKVKNRAKPVRRAIAFLNHHFAKKAGIRGQTIIEAATIPDDLKVEVNDDRVLQCCFFFANLSGDHKTLLYSKDNNLCNKAMASNFEAFSTFTSLVKYITKICQKEDIAYDNKQETYVDNYNQGSTSIKQPKPETNFPTTQKQCNSDSGIIDYNILSSVKESLRSALAFILEKEMINAYGSDMWLDVVVIRPPWTFLDLLHCMKKHWMAVFFMSGFDGVYCNLIEKLLEFAKQFKYKRKVKSENLISFVNGSIQLIKGLRKNYPNSSIINMSLKSLEKHMNSLKNPPLTLPAECTNNQSLSGDSCIDTVDFDLEETDCSPEEQSIALWLTLDQIWKVIVEHCASIFISLNIPLNAFTADDLPAELQSLLRDQSTINIPNYVLAVQVIPLLIELCSGFLASLERFLASYTINTAPTMPSCFDFLQTLWTMTKAFNLQTNIESVKASSVLKSCSEANNRLQLCNGFNKLKIIAQLIKNCSKFVLPSVT